MRRAGVFTRRLFVIATAALLTGQAQAGTPILSAPEASEMMEAGELVVLDIRSPEEWAKSGVAKGAWPVSMHVADFPQRLQAVLQNYDTSQIALICATGGRTNYVAGVLEKNGISGVIDISEGMFGNGKAPGWIARGLPVVTADEATRAYESATSGW